jgi:hypothetical protein
MKGYLEGKTEKRIAHSFYELDSLLEKQNHGYERHYIKLTRDNEVRGLAIFNVDHSATGELLARLMWLSFRKPWTKSLTLFGRPSIARILELSYSISLRKPRERFRQTLM